MITQNISRYIILIIVTNIIMLYIMITQLSRKHIYQYKHLDHDLRPHIDESASQSPLLHSPFYLPRVFYTPHLNSSMILNSGAI